MRVFKNGPFSRFARKAGLDDAALCRTVARAEQGLIDANLGGGVIKQRVARRGGGKSSGFRTMILYKRGQRAFFVYGFSKSERSNVSRDEITALKDLAAEMLAYDDATLVRAVASGALMEVDCHEKDEDVQDAKIP